MTADHPESLRIGITGHRPNKLPKAVIPRIERRLRDVMATIESTLRGTSAAPARIRLVSGFAEGVDQMAVAACPPHWTVEAILPFPKEEFLKDFEQSASGDGRDVRAEFLASLARASAVTELPMPQTGARAQGYLAAGRAMLRQIDILLAVWDGEDPKPGGTGAIVKEACEGGISVVWLSTDSDREPVRIERFEGGTPIVSAKPWATALSLPARPTRAGSA